MGERADEGKTMLMYKILLNSIRDDVFTKEGVVGVGIGYKRVDGKEVLPRQICFLVYVAKKLKSTEFVDKSKMIPPKYIFGEIEVMTDVIETGGEPQACSE